LEAPLRDGALRCPEVLLRELARLLRAADLLFFLRGLVSDLRIRLLRDSCNKKQRR
jgi:hypothetical protein